jgi:hypothetical protein
VSAHIDGVPFHSQNWHALVNGSDIEIFAYQPVVRISVTPAGLLELPLDTPSFLAVVDSGNTHNLAIREQHLEDWANLDLKELPMLAMKARVTGIGSQREWRPLYEAEVWLHPFPLEQRRLPLRLEIDGGIICYSTVRSQTNKAKKKTRMARSLGPRLPLLGGRAFTVQGLGVSIDYQNLKVTIGRQGAGSSH